MDREEGCAAEGTAPDGGWDFCGCRYFHRATPGTKPLPAAGWLS